MEYGVSCRFLKLWVEEVNRLRKFASLTGLLRLFCLFWFLVIFFLSHAVLIGKDSDAGRD